MFHSVSSLVLAVADLGCDDGPGHTAEPLLRLDHGRQVPCAGLPPLAGEPLRHGPQNWKQYAVALMLFNLVMFVFGFVVLSCQPSFPLNPDDKPMVAPTTIFNSVASFLTNTNLQHYSGEQHLPTSARSSSSAGTCSSRQASAFAPCRPSSAAFAATPTWAISTSICGASSSTCSCRPA